ncbi:2-octaprenyl-6-methoxyphenyl hydroxylase [Aurantivibrio plasticivorans]
MSNSETTEQTIRHCDIAIVGGGMVGIALALMLNRAQPDWSIVLIESVAFSKPDEKPYQSSFDARSTALAAGSEKILDACGIWSTLTQHLTPIDTVHVSDRGHFGGAEIHAAQYNMNAVGHVVENAWLGRVLMSELLSRPHITCLAPARVKKLTPLQQGYQIDLVDSDVAQLHANLTVIADGAESPLAKTLGVQFSTKPYQQTALITNIEMSEPHRCRAYERFTNAGPIALLPLGEASHSCTSALVWTLPEDQAESIASLDEDAFLNILQQRFGFRQGKFIRCAERFTYPLELKLACEQVRRGLVLMGNAAHFLHPVAGQGFNLALRDCWQLMKVLKDANDKNVALSDLHVLQQYIDKQILDQDLTVGLSDQMVRWFSSASMQQSVLRNLGLFLLDVVPGAGSLLSKRSMGLA